MRRPNPTFRPVVYLAVLACLTSNLWAELDIRAQLQTQTIAVGQTAYINVVVSGIDAPKQPTILIEKGDNSGLNFALSSSGSTQTRNGNQVSRAFSYRYSIMALKPGQYTLAAAIVDGQVNLATEPKELTVRPKTAEEKTLEPTFTIRATKSEIFVGEILPIQLVIASNPRTGLRQIYNGGPEVESNGFVMQPMSSLSSARDPDANGNDLYFFSGSCEPLRSGMLTLGPAKYPIELRVPRSDFRGFNSVRHNLESEPLKIKVKPLPTEGRPASFSGALGKFKLAMAASPKRLQQGEPISVSLVVSGEGNLPSIDMPEMTGEIERWKRYDPKRIDSRDANRDPRAARGSNGSVTFVQTIVPLEPLTEIPPYELSYFDPDSASYRTLRTDAIPIDVAAAELSSPPPSSVDIAASESPKPEPPAPKAPPVEEMSDILTIRDLGDQKWVGTSKPLLQSKLFWALQAPPAAALLTFIFLAIGRRSKDEKANSQWAGTYLPCAELLRQLEKKPKDASQFYHGANQVIAAWEEQAGAGALDDLDSERRQALREIRNRHSFLAFGSPANGEADCPVDKDEQLNILRTLKSLPGHA